MSKYKILLRRLQGYFEILKTEYFPKDSESAATGIVKYRDF
jgi:hypothetical protein